jgi:hypothetical protein
MTIQLSAMNVLTALLNAREHTEWGGDTKALTYSDGENSGGVTFTLTDDGVVCEIICADDPQEELAVYNAFLELAEVHNGQSA